MEQAGLERKRYIQQSSVFVVCNLSNIGRRKASPGNVQDFEELLYKNKELEDTAVTVAVCFSTEGQHKVIGSF